MKFAAIFLLLIALISCSKEPGNLVPPNLVSPAVDTLKISLTNNNEAADNYSYAEIVAVTNLPYPTSRSITFTTDKGLFSNNSNTYTLQTGANDTTRAYIKYNKAELVRVTATVTGTYS